MASGRVTYFVVIPFRAAEGRHEGVVADQPFEAPSAATAVKHAKRCAEQGGAALAFSRTGDPDIGEWSDAVILGQFGDVPPNLEHLVAA